VRRAIGLSRKGADPLCSLVKLRLPGHSRPPN
jgi:hypothetical protein